MHILIINAGSSSVKFTLFSIADVQVIAEGFIERIGLSNTAVHYKKASGEPISLQANVEDIFESVKLAADLLLDKKQGVIQSKKEIGAIGHRIVHGGEKVKDATIIDQRLKDITKECFNLAPLHNPPNLRGIEACEEIFPEIPQVAVFDTAFHTSLPEHAYLYGLPYEYYQEDEIRRYGFHGTSHKYVSRKAAEMLGWPLSTLKMVTCHLGNGCSIAAICQGQSIDTSMGLTPMEGLIMGTRCGDIDPSIPFHLMRRRKIDPKQMETILNQESGLFGLGGIGSGDMRDIEAAMFDGNKRAAMTVEIFAYRIKKYIGAYTFAMGGLDAIVFTAGIGENSALIRELICQNLEDMGIIIDQERNMISDQKRYEIQSDGSSVKILVIPTNEEKEIAMQAIKLLADELGSCRSPNSLSAIC